MPSSASSRAGPDRHGVGRQGRDRHRRRDGHRGRDRGRLRRRRSPGRARRPRRRPWPARRPRARLHVRGRRHHLGRGHRPPGDGGHDPRRAHRRTRQQRRDHDGHGRLPRCDRGPVRCHVRRQRARHLLPEPAGRPGDDRRGRRVDRQHRLEHLAHVRTGLAPLHGQQGRYQLTHDRPRRRAGTARDPRQHDRPGRDPGRARPRGLSVRDRAGSGSPASHCAGRAPPPRSAGSPSSWPPTPRPTSPGRSSRSMAASLRPEGEDRRG